MSKGDTVSAATLARWFGVTAKTVRELAKAGIPVRAVRGQWRGISRAGGQQWV